MTGKIWALGAIAASVGAIGFIAFGNLGENLVYYWSPTELRAAGAEATGATVRLGGMVEPGSLHQEGTTLTFTVGDGTNLVTVRANEIPPAMFREGIGVVVEGTLGSDGTFESQRLMVKHDNEYRAPTEGNTPDKQAMFGTLADETKN